jgi:methyl-accepting chemotaxis protein
MAFGLFRKRLPEPAAPSVAPQTVIPAAPADFASHSDSDSAKEILELLELELGAMIRQLDRAANSVASGAEATAATLVTIRQRTDALTGRTSAAQSTATTFSQAADKFTHSAQGIEFQVRAGAGSARRTNFDREHDPHLEATLCLIC